MVVPQYYDESDSDSEEDVIRSVSTHTEPKVKIESGDKDSNVKAVRRQPAAINEVAQKQTAEAIRSETREAKTSELSAPFKCPFCPQTVQRKQILCVISNDYTKTMPMSQNKCRLGDVFVLNVTRVLEE